MKDRKPWPQRLTFLTHRFRPTGVGGEIAYSYEPSSDPASRGLLTAVAVDGETMAEVSYDTLGRIDGVTYPNGSGEAGNGTSLEEIRYDAFGRPDKAVWRTATNPIAAEGLLDLPCTEPGEFKRSGAPLA